MKIDTRFLRLDVDINESEQMATGRVRSAGFAYRRFDSRHNVNVVVRSDVNPRSCASFLLLISSLIALLYAFVEFDYVPAVNLVNQFEVSNIASIYASSHYSRYGFVRTMSSIIDVF